MTWYRHVLCSQVESWRHALLIAAHLGGHVVEVGKIKKLSIYKSMLMAAVFWHFFNLLE